MRLLRASSSRDERRSRGQALVEFAFAAPIFFLLLIGLLEGGRYVFYSESLNHAAREGARHAIIHGSASRPIAAQTGPGSPDDPGGEAVKQAVRDAAVGMGDPGAISIPNPNYSPNNNRRGSTVTVSVTYTYTPVVSIFGPITVDAEATLVVNN
ncbi:MAG: TadE/TadG family type IV pilus assembly protein [Candidatus Limnocylindria bacterium]